MNDITVKTDKPTTSVSVDAKPSTLLDDIVVVRKDPEPTRERSREDTPPPAVSPMFKPHGLEFLLDGKQYEYDPRASPSSTPRSSSRSSRSTRSSSSSSSGRSSSRSSRSSDALTRRKKANEKAFLLYSLERLRKSGATVVGEYSMDSDVRDIENEIARIKQERDSDAALQAARKGLIFVTSGVELFLNTRFNPFSFNLDGWSPHVQSQIENYDSMFEELIEKYKHRWNNTIPVELQLIGALGASAFMFHMSKTMVNAMASGAISPESINAMANAYTKLSGKPEQREMRGPKPVMVPPETSSGTASSITPPSNTTRPLGPGPNLSGPRNATTRNGPLGTSGDSDNDDTASNSSSSSGSSDDSDTRTVLLQPPKAVRGRGAPRARGMRGRKAGP